MLSAMPSSSPTNRRARFSKAIAKERCRKNTRGAGLEGVKALREFIEAGGTLITLNAASDFAIEQFGLPLRDVTEGLKRTEFYCPARSCASSWTRRIRIAKGMPRESIAWVEDSPVFEVGRDSYGGGASASSRATGQSGTPLLSGWLLGAREDKRKGRARRSQSRQGARLSFRLPPAVPRPVARHLPATLQRNCGPVKSG